MESPTFIVEVDGEYALYTVKKPFEIDDADTLPTNVPPCTFCWRWGCLKSWLLFRHPHEFKIKSLYNNDLILNIASKSKETVPKLKFLDSPASVHNHGRPCRF